MKNNNHIPPNRSIEPFGSVRELKGSVNKLFGSVKELKSLVNELIGSVKELKGLVKELFGSVRELKGLVNELFGSVRELKGLFTDINGSIVHALCFNGQWLKSSIQLESGAANGRWLIFYNENSLT